MKQIGELLIRAAVVMINRLHSLLFPTGIAILILFSLHLLGIDPFLALGVFIGIALGLLTMGIIARAIQL